MPVNDHYTFGEIQCIDAMQAQCTITEFRAYLRMNIVKYIWRINHKDTPVDNLHKAKWYIEKLMKTYE